MYKVILLLKARSGTAPDTLTRVWLEQPWGGIDEQTTVLRHLHNQTVPGAIPIENAPAAAFDAVDEFWFADRDAAKTWFASHAFIDFWNGHCGDLLDGPPLALSGRPHLLLDRVDAEARDPVKIITLPVRREGMTHDAFAHHWVHVHSRLALDGPGTRERLQRLEPCPSDNGTVGSFSPAPFGGAGTIEFADRRDLQAEFESEYYRTVMAQDEPRFTNPAKSCALIVTPFSLSGVR